MLGKSNVTATIAVKDLKAAREFYEDTLGLNKAEEFPGGISYRSGDSDLLVYESDTGGTGQATVATWQVDDLEGVVDELQKNGVNFEKYELPGAVVKGAVHIMGPQKAAWCKDPSGNILGIVNII